MEAGRRRWRWGDLDTSRNKQMDVDEEHKKVEEKQIEVEEKQRELEK
jgi:hypothetical protein